MLDPNDHVLDYVDAYLHDLLTAVDAETLEKHCAACKICQVAMVEARRRLEALQTLPVVEAPESLIRAAQSKIDRYRRRRWTPVRVGLLAAAVFFIMFAGLHVYYLTLSASFYDLRILGQSEWLAESGASLRVLLVNHDSGQPIEGVPVEIDLADRKTDRTIRLVNFTTDQWGSGHPQFRLPDWEGGEYELRVSAHPGRTSESIVRTVKLKRSWQLMLTSDKPVYQPGQVIHVRSLALAQPELKPVAGHNVSYAIRDPKGNVIFRKQDVTSRFGIASAECPLADEIAEGAYQIECQVGDTTSTATVEVKKYVLPKFKIELSLDQPYYQPGQKARGTVQARYFFGKAVEDAAVEIAVDVKDVGANTICRLQRRTDAAGSAPFEFTAAGTPCRAGTAFRRRIDLDSCHGRRFGRAEGVQNTVADRDGPADPYRGHSRVGHAGQGDCQRHLSLHKLSRRPAGPNADYPQRHPSRAVEQPLGGGPRGTDSRGRRGCLDDPRHRRPGKDRPPRGGPGVRKGCRRLPRAHRRGRLRRRPNTARPRSRRRQRARVSRPDQRRPDHAHRSDSHERRPRASMISTSRRSFSAPSNCPRIVMATAGLPVRKTQVIYVRPCRAVKIETTLDRKEYRPGERAKISFRLTDERASPHAGRVEPGGGRRSGLLRARPAAGHGEDVLHVGAGIAQAGLCHLSLVARHAARCRSGGTRLSWRRRCSPAPRKDHRSATRCSPSWSRNTPKVTCECWTSCSGPTWIN